MNLLIALLLCLLVGIVTGFIIGFVLGHDLAERPVKDDMTLETMEAIDIPKMAADDVWREDLDDPEG